MNTLSHERPEVSTYVPSRTPGPETLIENIDAKIIMLFGCTGTGKTSFANIASGGQMEVGNGLQSSTKHLEASNAFRLDDQSVIIVDCPGFNDTYLTETEVIRRIAEFLTKAYNLKYKVVGFLYFHKISETRLGGTMFRHMNMFKALCGAVALKNVVYVTNMWSEPPTEVEILREMELRDKDKFFGGALAEGAQMARHNNTHDSAQNIIRMLLGKTTVVTELQTQLVHHGIPLKETDVGLVIGHDLEDNLRRQQDEMEGLMAQKQKALEANDQNWLQRLESQEERMGIIEKQLVDQLQSLKAMKARQSVTTSPRAHESRSEAIIDSGLSSCQTRMIVNTIQDEPARKAQLQDFKNQFAARVLTQQERNRQREEEGARYIARIRATAGTTSWLESFNYFIDFFTTAKKFFVELCRNNASSISNEVQENRSPSHGSSRTHPTETRNSPNMEYQYEQLTDVPQAHRPDIDKRDHNEDRGHTSTSERQRQSYGSRSREDSS